MRVSLFSVAMEMHVSDSLDKCWVRDGDRISLRVGNQVAAVSAHDIVASEYQSPHTANDYGDLPVPSDDIPGVRISRFPLIPRLCVSVDSEGRFRPVAWLRLEGSSTTFDSPEMSAQEQVLVDDDWYPVVADKELFDILSRHQLKHPGAISFGTYRDLVGIEEVLVSPWIDVPDEYHTALTDKSAVYHISDGFLYGYQNNGVDWMVRLTEEGLGCLLGDEMGLGKTIQIIALILHRRESLAPALIVAPATLVENWRREITKFGTGLDLHIHHGSDRTGFPSHLRDHDVVVTTYDTVLRDGPMLAMVSWGAIVLDEAQMIRNPNAQRSKAVKDLPRKVGIPVTGTPIQNRLQDLWSIFDFMLPGFLGNLSSFERQYANDVEDAQRLEPLVSPFILRRTVPEVASDLPDRVDIPFAIALSDAAAQQYELIRTRTLEEYGPAGGLVALTRLRQFCTHPSLLSRSTADPILLSTKYERLVEIVDEIKMRSEKLVVFTSFTGMVDIAVRDLSARLQLPTYWVDGRTPIPDRQQIIDEFQSCDGSATLVLNPNAAGTGLNITEANHVVHYNLEWNPAVEDQATARVHRRGQSRPVFVYRLYHANTVEEIIDNRLSRKREIAAHAVIGTDGVDAVDDIQNALAVSPIHHT